MHFVDIPAMRLERATGFPAQRNRREVGALEFAAGRKDRDYTFWTDGSRIEGGGVGAAVV